MAPNVSPALKTECPAPFLSSLWKLCCSPWPLSRRIATILACLLAAYCAAIGYLGALHTTMFGHDYFIFLDGGWRVLNGQRPHVDFHTAIGPIQALYSVFAMRVVPGNASAGFGIARALVTATFTVWCILLLRNRLSPAIAIAATCMVALLAGAPFPLTSSPFTQSMAMFYNRFGYVLLALIIFEGFRPFPATYMGGFSTGMALGLLLFLKISFFGVALGFVALSLLGTRPGGRRLAGIVGAFAGVLLGFLIWLRFDISAIVYDLRMGAVARSSGFPMHRFLRTMNDSLLGILLTLSLGLVAAMLSWSGRPRSLENLRPLALALLAAVSEPIVSISNQQDAVFILMGVCTFIFVASITSSACSVNIHARPLLAAVSMLALCVPVRGSAYDLVGFCYSLQHAFRHAGAPDVPRLDAPELSSLIFEGEMPGAYKYDNGSPLVQVVNDGIHLLRATTAPMDRVLTLGFSNPFSVCLRRAAPRGASTWFSFGMNISADNYIPAPALFAEAEAVMVPTYITDERATTEALLAEYGSVLQRDYELKARSAFWMLYLKHKAAR